MKVIGKNINVLSDRQIINIRNQCNLCDHLAPCFLTPHSFPPCPSFLISMLKSESTAGCVHIKKRSSSHKWPEVISENGSLFT